MRKGLLFSFVFWASLLLQAVAQNEPTQSSAIPSEFIDIVSDSGLNDFFLHTSGRIWKDLDAFYQSNFEKHSDNPYFFNFKFATISCLVKVYMILEDSSEEATQKIGYYTEEMAGLKNCSPELLYPCLVRLQGYWEPSKISQVAAVGYKNATSLFNVMKKDNPSYEARKIGMENLKSLFAVKK